MKSKTSSVAVGAAILSVGTIISRLLGLYRERLILGAYGDTNIGGAYKSAFMVPDLLYYLLAGGALSAAFIPVFSSYLAKNRQDDANKTGSSIANLMLVAILIGLVFELIFAPYLVRVIAPGYQPGSQVFNMTVSLTRMLCVMVIFTALSGLLTGMLNSFHHFLAPTLVWNTYNIGIILGVLVFRKLHWNGHELGIYGVALGVILGAFSMAAIQLPVLIKYGFRYSPIIDLAHEGVRKVLIYFVPVMIAFSLSQFNLMTVPQIVASLLGPPAVTDTSTAIRLVLLPLGIFAVAISTAAFPRLAQQVALGEKTAFRETLGGSLKAVLLLTIPSVVGMYMLAEPITYLLWGGDEFGASGVKAASFSLMFLAWALLGISVMQIGNRAFFSLNKNLVPMLISLGMAVTNLILALIFIYLTPLKYGGVALSTSITMTAAMLVLLELLRRELNGLGGAAILRMTVKVLVASCLMAATIYGVGHVLAPTLRYRPPTSPKATAVTPGPEVIEPRFLPRFEQGEAPFVPRSKPEVGMEPRLVVPTHGLLLQVGASIAAAMLVYLAALWLMKVEELNLVTSKVLNKLRRKPATV